jgi:NADP-dependent 3-hydroxy acid dehydrogenase YdfG
MYHSDHMHPSSKTSTAPQNSGIVLITGGVRGIGLETASVLGA